MHDVMMAGGNANLKAQGNIIGCGIVIKAKNDINFEGSGIFLGAAVGYNTSESSHTSKKFGGSKKTEITKSSMPVFLANFLEAGRITVKAKKAIFKGTKVKSKELNLDTEQPVEFDSHAANANYSQTVNLKQPFSTNTQTNGGFQELEVKSCLEVDKINNNHKLKLTNVDWDKTKTEIIGGYEEITKRLKSGSYSNSSSSGFGSSKLIAVIGIAASIAMQQYQVGASFLSSLGATGLVTKMGVAALSVAASQAAVSLAQTGNPIEAGKTLFEDRSMRQMLQGALSAGLLHGIQSQSGLGIDLNVEGSLKVMDHLKVGTIQGVTNMVTGLVISKQDPQDILKQGSLSIVANTLGSYGASQIGANFDGNLSAQIAAHFLSSGMAGWILDQSSKGFISAGMGAVVAKLTMSSLKSLANEKEQELYNKATADGKPLTIDKINEIRAGVRTELEKHLAIAQISSATLAAICNLNSDTAAHFASVTGRNNCLVSADREMVEKYMPMEVLAQLHAQEVLKKEEEEKARLIQEKQDHKEYLEQYYHAKQDYVENELYNYELLSGEIPDYQDRARITLEAEIEFADQHFTTQFVKTVGNVAANSWRLIPALSRLFLEALIFRFLFNFAKF